jgi:hypothetical protein
MNITIVNRGHIIPAIKYGGTERVIWGLGYELHRLGHKVTFIIDKGSACPFATVVVYDNTVDLQTLVPQDTDLVHINFIPDTPLTTPYIVTMHNNAGPQTEFPLNTVFVSKDHAQRHHSDVYVHNGLLWSDYPTIDLNKKRLWLHFLGKGSWKVKNLAGAAKIAVKSGNILKVLGAHRWKFYNFKRKPFYSLHPKLSYMGMADNPTKAKVMQQSKGLLFAVKWQEPFGLAIIESLYCGAPVFGFNVGSLPELVQPNVGVTANTEEELISAIKTKTFNPQECHEYAVTNFNSELMTRRYLALYQKVLNGETLNKTAPYAS